MGIAVVARSRSLTRSSGTGAQPQSQAVVTLHYLGSSQRHQLGSPSTHRHLVATVVARSTATARMATISIGGKSALAVLLTESRAGAAMVPGSVSVAALEAVRARRPAFGALTRCMSALVPLWISSMAVVAMVVVPTGLTVVQASRSQGTNSDAVHLLTRSGSSARTSESRILQSTSL